MPPSAAEVKRLIQSAPDSATKEALGHLVARLQSEEQEAADLEFFTKSVKDPMSWLDQSAKLLIAARQLEAPIREAHVPTPEEAALGTELSLSTEQKTLYAVQVLVAAFAIENALKAVFAANNQLQIDNSGRLFGPWKDGHDLVILAEKAGYPIGSPDERGWLRALAHFGTWIGRYPVPKSAEILARCYGPSEIPEAHPDLVEYAGIVVHWCVAEVNRIRASKLPERNAP